MAPKTGLIVYDGMVPVQGVAFPLINPGLLGFDEIDKFWLHELEPHELLALTLMFPLLKEELNLNEIDEVPCPLIMFAFRGTVQL